MTAAVLHAAQQKGGSVREKGRARIEDTIDLVRPVRGCQNGIEFVALK